VRSFIHAAQRRPRFYALRRLEDKDIPQLTQTLASQITALVQRRFGDRSPPTKKPAAEESQKKKIKRKNYTWAEMIQRVFATDATVCGKCSGKLRLIPFGVYGQFYDEYSLF